ncbi:hypothetical protein ILP92_11700 [Maribius pontilimi]|uniref:Uncharacterized protein n=1 Tax=Palleronia pontilimi TaxID=1964209 RepID=A0A934MDE0_9RHOB|nr:hypothetical protein [Palleronia pontilimi]MBJ3763410.1 hypothetical protein [Palleronia pontilimi]
MLKLPSLRPTLPQVFILATCLAFFAYMVAGYYAAQDTASRRLALRNLPPATVSIIEFEPARDVGLAREVSVRAQIDPAFAMRRSLLLDGQSRIALIVPILAPEPMEFVDPDMIFGYIVVPLQRGESDAEALRRTLPDPDENGLYGQIHTIAGQRLNQTRLAGGISETIAGWGRVTSRSPVLIQPYDGPREVALSRQLRGGYLRIFLWATIALAAASVTLLVAQHRLRLERRLSHVARHRRPGSGKPNGAKAMARFAPLREQELLEDAGDPQGPVSLIERMRARIGRQMS